ncbi:unnamed protein product [Zymoseptoria tritici ST99CH_3D7]|uniref:Uncharacterized protein n=1 Tax=Zymoseptoria tritici (strain ST99CH_3D7) TaxID=1276538 RepID=A0A1X7S8B9_ZYMT9|nr:unnamed protein product [Zymoseptoria tritici ST99CH_3D7]
MNPLQGNFFRRHSASRTGSKQHEVQKLYLKSRTSDSIQCVVESRKADAKDKRCLDPISRVKDHSYTNLGTQNTPQNRFTVGPFAAPIIHATHAAVNEVNNVDPSMVYKWTLMSADKAHS